MQLLKLRYYQIKRDLSYWTVIIAAIVFYFSLQLSELKANHTWILLGIVIFLFFNYHLNRPDLSFIKKYLNSPKLQVTANYNLLILPLSLGAMFSIGWLYFVLLHILTSLIAFTELKLATFKLLFISKFIPSTQFEWISGLRSNLFILSILFLIALILSPVKLFGIAALFLVNIVFIGFYNFFEPLLMLNPMNLKTELFLKQKINYFIKIILVTNVPILLINSIFNADVVSFNFFFLIAFILLAACSVNIKYATYQPNEQLGFNADFLILIASIFLPYLLPLSVLIYFNTWKKAKNNLAMYIHDNS